MPTASLLLRLSGAATDDSTGFVSQETDLKALAALHNADVLAVHIDDGLSGALRDRPGFLAWLEDGRSGRADILMAWKLDRVSRGGPAGLARFLDVVEGLDDLGKRAHAPVRFLSYSDRLDSQAPGWDIQAAVLGALAKGERDAIRARILRYRETARQQGRVSGGRRAWAFTAERSPNGVGLRLRPVPSHAAAIRWALDHLRSGGSKTAIAREWSARGLQPKGSDKARKAGRSTAWHVTPISRILRNPNLYGAELHNDDVIRNEDGTARIDAAQAILTLSEFVELQALLNHRATSRDNPTRTDPALLAGLLICASCYRVMYPHRPAKGRTWTYRCRGGLSCPAPTSVHMAEADAFLTAEFHRLIGDVPETLGGWEPDVPTVDLDEIAHLTEAVKAADAALSDDLSDEDALATLRQRRELKARLALLQDAADLAAALTDALRVRNSGRTYSEAFNEAESVPDKARLLALAFGDGVTVAPGTKGTFDPARLSW